MRILRFSLCCLFFTVIIALAASYVRADSQDQDDTTATMAISGLASPYKATLFPMPKPKDTTAPYFTHGYLVQFVHYTTLQGQSNIYIYDGSGLLKSTLTIWPKDSAKLFISSVDIGRDHRLAFAGKEIKQDGTTFSFIATSNSLGHSIQYFSTDNYVASQIAVADDGTIWAVGAELPQNMTTNLQKTWRNYDTIRHYTFQGGLLGHYLSRWGSQVAYLRSEVDETGNLSSIAYSSNGTPLKLPNQNAIWGYRDAWKASRQVFLRTSGDLTVLYDGLHDRLCLYDDTKGAFSCEQIVGAYSEGAIITGFALLSGNHIIASMKGDEPDGTWFRGLFVLIPQTSTQSHRWVVVSGTKSSSTVKSDFFELLGSNGRSLAYRRRQGRQASATVYESTW